MYTRFRRFKALIKRQSRKIFVSLSLSALIIILCYLMNNCSYPYWDSLDKFSWIEYLLGNSASDNIPDFIDFLSQEKCPLVISEL